MDDALLQEIISPPRGNLSVLPAAVLRWQPEDFQGIAVFLASGGSDFLTGTSIPVDGGFSIQI